MFELPPLYAIVNVEAHANPLDFVRRLLEAGAELIQLRAKNLPAQELVALTEKSIELRNHLNPQAKILLNDAWQLCNESGADGVHLGQTDENPNTVREALGGSALIGYSTHNLKQIEAAPVSALSYLALGPIFESPTKSGHAPIVGLELLHRAAKISPLPLVAIGGINEANAESVFEAGAKSVAVISDLERSIDISTTVAKYLRP